MNPYIPQELPIQQLNFKRLLPEVGNANAALARYDGLLQGIVNPSLMLSPLLTEEAVLSSRLEGTQATVDDIYEHEAGILPEHQGNNDVQEVANYRYALREAQEQLLHSPITLFTIRAIHRALLTGVRGQNKDPGNFRTDQNWIGRNGCAIEQAVFVPPSPLRLMGDLENWLAYLKGEDLDVLLQTAVMHAQFEMLHPFKDGNGRIGRLLIPLFLFQKRCLSQPMFYLSSYLEANRDAYYMHLGAISREGDWDGWIVFFLRAITQQAQTNISRVNQIRNLYEDLKAVITSITHSQHAITVLDQIFKHPIFKTTSFIEETKILKPTAMTLLRHLKEKGILIEMIPGKGRRPAVLCFPALLAIAAGKEIV